MTKIDFYILPQETLSARQHFACRLTEKAVSQGNRVMLATRDSHETQILDELLWTFRPESFLPHASTGDNETEKAPILISHAGDDMSHHDVLINLRNEIPEIFSRFQRLAEIVVQEPDVLSATRQHFAFYKERGYALDTHKI